MAREPGSKTVTFSPAELDQFSLTFEEDIGAAVRSRLSSNALDADILASLAPDLRDFAEARSHHLGAPVKEIVESLLRQVMIQSYSPAKAA